MKFFRLLCLLCCLYLCLLCASAMAESSTLRWCEHALQLQTIRVDPEQITNPQPEIDTYLYIRMKCPENGIDLFELIENLSFFELADTAGSTYPVRAYMPYSMMFNERSGVFTTAPLQSQFDLLFILPTGVDVSALILQTEADSLALADLPEDVLIDESPSPAL